MKNTKTTTKHFKTRNKGSVLVVITVIASVLFSIGLTFSSILAREVARQFYTQQSQVALNIANSAFECTLYNDFRRYVFDPVLHISDEKIKFDCGELYAVVKEDDWSAAYTPKDKRDGSDDEYSFEIVELPEPGVTDDLETKTAPCAHVEVKRIEGVKTIEIKGYYECASDNKEERELVRRFKVVY